MEEIYKVTEADLIGDIEHFPIEVVQLMVERQFEQNGFCDVSIFQWAKDAGGRGFIWANSLEGRDFWNCVINKCDFDSFFRLYPNIESISTGKKAKPIKTKHISWTRQQKWVLERLSHAEGSLEERLQRFSICCDLCHLSESPIGIPVLTEDIDKAINLFGRWTHSDTSALEKTKTIAYVMMREVRNIKRIYESFFKHAPLEPLEMFTDIKDAVALRTHAMNWIKHNPWVGSRLCSRVYFYGFNCGVSFVPNRRTKIIPKGFKKNHHGFYQLCDAVLIGDCIYLFQ